MHKQIIKNMMISACVLLLSACNGGWFDKDNTQPPTPLTKITSEVNPRLLWSTKAGYGSGDEFLKMSPSIDETTIYVASIKGTVTSINKADGRINWTVATHLPLTTGPGIGDGMIVVASRRGDVEALRPTNGAVLWKTSVPGEILAKPAIANGTIITKTIDGYVRALSIQDGHELWSFQQVEPSLVLRGASSPLIRDRSAVVGFANGNLGRFSLNDGRLLWLQPIAVPQGAFAIQRMIDIDADPLMHDHHLYAATYQGQITSLAWESGRVLWSHDISSYTGMIADNDTVYITDAKSHVWAFGADSGLVNWRQTKLEARNLSGPATLGNYVVVGDNEGYLHWLGKTDGHFAGRVSTGSGIYAAPIVENNVLYVLTTNGHLLAYI